MPTDAVIQYGAFGILALLVTVGLPIFFKWFLWSIHTERVQWQKDRDADRETRKKEADEFRSTSERIATTHREVVADLIATFKSEQKFEREQCEKQHLALMDRMDSRHNLTREIVSAMRETAIADQKKADSKAVI